MIRHSILTASAFLVRVHSNWSTFCGSPSSIDVPSRRISSALDVIAPPALERGPLGPILSRRNLVVSQIAPLITE